MKKSRALLLCAASLLVFSTVVSAAEPPLILVSRAGDTEMSCGALSREAMLMREVIAATQNVRDDARMKGRGITAAGTLGSLLVGTVTGGAGIMAAGLLMGRANDVKDDKAASLQDLAEQRRALMMGIYNARGCYGPLDHVMQAPRTQETRVATTWRAPDRKPAYNP